MLKGKYCVVTGGAGGIGRCIAQAMAESGAQVAVIDKDGAAGEALAKRYPESIWFYQGDIAEQQTLEAFAAQVKERFGRVDCLINNACLSRKGLLSACSYADFSYVLQVGVTAPYYLTLLLGEILGQGASIVNLSSTRAFQSQQDTESYSAAKGGITALTHALAASLAGKARVNSVSPGWIDTGAYHEGSGAGQHTQADTRQHTAGRVGTPEDIAKMVLYLCSPHAQFINGQNITVDGGMSKLMIYHDDCGWSYQPEAE